MVQNKPKPRKTIIEALNEARLPLTPENLFSATGHQPDAIEDFYQELKTEVSSGHVEELRTGSSADNATGETSLRIKELKIREFKNLRDFVVSFDPSGLTTVILGQNGTGKSNLLEALVVIFRDLDLGEPPSFEYESPTSAAEETSDLRQESEVRPVRSKSLSMGNPSHTRRFGEIRPGDSCRATSSAIIQDQAIASNRISGSTRRSLHRQLLENKTGDALRPLFYARLIHSQFVLLAFFYEHHELASGFLEEYLGIADLESVLFVLKEPPWASKEGDPRFWYAKGAVQVFLAESSFATPSLHYDSKLRVEVGRSKTKNQERLYLFLKDREALKRLRLHYVTPGISSRP